MNMNRPHPSVSIRGNTLITTLIVTGTIGVILVGYLGMISSQYRSTMRSQVWNSTMPIVEAGIEEGLAHLNRNCLSNNINGAAFDPTADGWTTAATDVYTKSRDLGGGAAYQVYIDFSGIHRAAPIITAHGYLPPPLVAASGGPMFAQVGNTQNGELINQTPSPYVGKVKRTVWVETAVQTLAKGALVAKGAINLNGNNIATDAFDSSDPMFSSGGTWNGTNYSGGQYDSTHIVARGDVATNSKLTNSLNVGNANIMGYIKTGQGGVPSIGPNGSVGNVNWVSTSQSGIQQGYFADDMNASFPDVQVPFTTGSSPLLNVSVTLTNRVCTNSTVFSATYPPPYFGGTIVTNTTPTNSTSFPASGTYLGFVVTNRAVVTNAAWPGYSVGTIRTNTTAVTTTGYPASGTYIGSVTTNCANRTTDTYPSAALCNPLVTTNYAGKKIKDYSYRAVADYYYNRIDNYTYEDPSSSVYSYYKITGYTRVFESCTTNTTTTVYNQVFDTGNYVVNTLDGKVLVRGHAVVYCTGSIAMTGQEFVKILSGASLKLYAAGPSVDLGGQGTMNESGSAQNFQLYGLNSMTSLSIGGNGAFTGTIYAPYAHFSMNGGGNDNLDFVGSATVSSIQMNGHFNFHYDIALEKYGPATGFLISKWNEEVMPGQAPNTP